jgi:outer membrane immunogenic protein
MAKTACPEFGAWEEFMKKIVLGLLAAALSATPLFAADMATRAPVYKAAPVQQMFNWSGFYVGGYAGWMNGKSQDVSGAGPEVSLNGGAFGGLLGVNWQTGNFVWGLEGDGGWSTADHGADGTNFSWFKDRFIGNLRVRAGVAADRALFYVAGGAAFTDLKISHGGSDLASEMRVGWTVGAGIDYAATQNLVLRLEYLYAGFGEKNYTFIGNDVHRVNYDNQNTVRAAAIWKW